MQPKPATIPCTVQRLGLVEYQEAWEEQRRLVEACREDGCARLLLLEHPPTYTFGARGRQEHLLLSEEALAELGPTVHRVDRGGDVTFHGPGQLVGYPILDLRRWHQGPLWYVRSLEATLIEALSAFGIAARRVPRRPGVWVGEAKIAAIGVRVSRGITSHGFALNVDPDLQYFSYIVPCGLPDARVTSMAKVLAAGRPEGRPLRGSGVPCGLPDARVTSMAKVLGAGRPEGRPLQGSGVPCGLPDARVTSMAEVLGAGRPEGRPLQGSGVPCGLPDAAVTSMAEVLRYRTMDGGASNREGMPPPSGGGGEPPRELGRAPSMDAVMDAVIDAFARVFPVEVREAPVEAASVG